MKPAEHNKQARDRASADSREQLGHKRDKSAHDLGEALERAAQYRRPTLWQRFRRKMGWD